MTVIGVDTIVWVGALVLLAAVAILLIVIAPPTATPPMILRRSLAGVVAQAREVAPSSRRLTTRLHSRADRLHPARLPNA